MNILYSFRYKQRFCDVIALFSEQDKIVTELCFGDIYIANYCSKNNILWQGFDINNYFVSYALKNNFSATNIDISQMQSFPKADVCIMIGSLYHFHNEAESMLLKMLNCAPKIILSEPIINLSSGKGIIGFLAKKFTNAGKGTEAFRYNKKSILKTLNRLTEKLKFKYKIIHIQRDILIEIIDERN